MASVNAATIPSLKSMLFADSGFSCAASFMNAIEVLPMPGFA
jgi:hypothetical protein